jgi:two-component system NtrC family sensor kinase
MDLSPPPKNEHEASGLRWRIVGAILLAALVPLAGGGVGSWIILGGMLEDKSLEFHRALVAGHANQIDAYLLERLRALELASSSLLLQDLENPDALERLRERLNAAWAESFTDLGVIDESGRHLAYAGPYPLKDKTYADQAWFAEAIRAETYVSDVFLGHRQVPHCILTVRRMDQRGVWLLRATINSRGFEALVHTVQLGQTGDVFLLNTAGVYQTPPRTGEILEPSAVPVQLHRGVSDSRVESDGHILLRSTTWLNRDRWMLVIQQAEEEIQAPVHRALMLGAGVLLLALLLVAVTSLLATWHLIVKIDRVNAQRDALTKDLLRSAKLASLGEMSTGLAHEINNPLAIISAEQTNIDDVLAEIDPPSPQVIEARDSVARIGRQVKRCGAITAKMLQFGRDTDTAPQACELAPKLEEIVGLLERQAKIRNVTLELEVEDHLPQLRVDPTELQQVIVNLINNSLYAIKAGGSIRVAARRQGLQVELTVADDGEGIPAEQIDRVFQPFFTTKPPGQGTGLGLSVCYGIVTGWGGTIKATSRPGLGTRMTIALPIPKH